MRTTFSVLGPLHVGHVGHVVHEERDLTPSAHKLRTVLAVLVLAPNTVVTSDTMIEELWGAEPPASARNTLQSYVVHLRRCVDATGSSARIDTVSYGYRLDVDPAAVDWAAFRAHITTARAARAHGDARAARDELSWALDLWRGRPLVNVPQGPLLQASHSYLTELWLSAIERRIALDIEVGGHHDVLGELTLLCGQHPLNENLVAQLMLALHRSGRRYGALKAYDALCRSLATELGLDPCAALQRLHRAVLNGDPALDRSVDGTAAPLPIDLLTA